MSAFLGNIEFVLRAGQKKTLKYLERQDVQVQVIMDGESVYKGSLVASGHFLRFSVWYRPIVLFDTIAKIGVQHNFINRGEALYVHGTSFLVKLYPAPECKVMVRYTFQIVKAGGMERLILNGELGKPMVV